MECEGDIELFRDTRYSAIVTSHVRNIRLRVVSALLFISNWQLRLRFRLNDKFS
jgi:hypothetical protein